MGNLRLRVILMAFGVALSWMWASGDFLWAQEPVYDVVIRGGRIVDGTGNPWFEGDVGIQRGRITAVGLVSGGARRVIDAEGLVVAPGFIDLHTHSDLPLLRNGNAESKIRQGVTLDVLGEVSSVAPRDGLDNEDLGGGKIIDWTTFTGYFDRVQKQGIAINIISHCFIPTLQGLYPCP